MIGYGDLIKHYEVSLSQMFHDILGHYHVQWHPQSIRHYTNLWTYYRTGPYYRFWPDYQISRDFRGALQRVRLATEDAYSSGHLVLSKFGTCICSNVVMSTDLLSFEHPSVLLFCFKGFRWNICNGCVMLTEDAYASRHMVLSGIRTFICYRGIMLRQVSPKLVIFPDFEFWTSLGTYISILGIMSRRLHTSFFLPYLIGPWVTDEVSNTGRNAHMIHIIGVRFL